MTAFDPKRSSSFFQVYLIPLPGFSIKALCNRCTRYLESPDVYSIRRESSVLGVMITSLVMFLNEALQVWKFSGRLSNFSILFEISSLLAMNWMRVSIFSSVGCGTWAAWTGLNGGTPGSSFLSTFT